MTYELSVLRAIMRLSKKGQAAHVDALLDRAGGERATVRVALRRLDSLGLVERLDQETARLTMAGFVVAVGTARQAGSRTVAQQTGAPAGFSAAGERHGASAAKVSRRGSTTSSRRAAA